MYHTITIVGHLGHDPQLRHTSDGTPVTNLSVAANRTWKRPDGSQGEETVWFRVTAWRRLAEACAQYLCKGRQVLVEGRLKPDPDSGGPRVYQRDDGTCGARYEVTASTVKFLGGRGESGPETSGGLDGPDGPAPEGGEEIPF